MLDFTSDFIIVSNFDLLYEFDSPTKLQCWMKQLSTWSHCSYKCRL